MYSQSRLIFRQNLRYFLAGAMCLLLSKALVEIQVNWVIDTLINSVVSLILTFCVFASFLFDKPFHSAIAALPEPWLRFFRYTLKLSAILVVFAVFGAFVELFDLRTRLGTKSSNEFIASYMGVLVVFPIVFSFWGTWLAATVFNRSQGFGEATRRAWKVFLPLVWRLLLIGILDFVIRLIFAIIYSIFGGEQKAMVLSNDGGINIGATIIILLIYLVDLFTMTMSAVAISRAFLRAEGLPIPEIRSAQAAV